MSTWLQGVANWPWGPIAATILGSGAVSAACAHLFQSRREADARRRDAASTAIAAAQRLEGYAREVALVADSWKSVTPYSQDDSAKPWPSVPDIDQLDWRSVEKRLTDRALGFREEVAKQRALVSAYFEDDDDAGIDQAVESSLSLGLTSWNLAADLRWEYGFPAGRSRVNQHYDFIEWMNVQQSERTARNEAHDQHRT